MGRSIVARGLRRPPTALLLAATTVLGLSAAVAILRLTSTETQELTLPVVRPERAKTPRVSLRSEPSVQSTLGESQQTTVPSLDRPAPHYRWEQIPGVAELIGAGSRSGLSAVALVEDEGLIALGNAGSTPVVLVSPDGRDWTRVHEAEPSLDGAILRDVAVVGERLVAVGSLEGEPAAWASSDAIHWAAISITAPTDGRTLGLLDGIAVSPDGAVVAVGFAAGSSGVWTLADGSFTPVDALRPVPAGGQVLADVASTAVGFVVGGNDADGRPVIWQSEDAVEWARSDLPADGRGASVAAVGEVAGRLVAVGYDADGARMWSAADDRWLDVDTPAATDGGPQALWAVATGESGGLTTGQRPGGPLCWASGDGADWVDCHPDEEFVVASTNDLISTNDGFVGVGSATVAGAGAGAAIWWVELDN